MYETSRCGEQGSAPISSLGKAIAEHANRWVRSLV